MSTSLRIVAAVLVSVFVFDSAVSVTHAQTSGNAPTLLGSVNAATPFASAGDAYIQMLGSSHPLTGVSETTGITGADAITGPSTLGSSLMRFGKIPDPVNPSRQVFYLAAKLSDGQTFFHNGRTDIVFSNSGTMEKSGTIYWIAVENYIPSAIFSGGPANVIDIHNSTPPSTVFGPFALTFQNGIFPNPGMSVVTAWSSQSDPSLPGFNDNEFYPWTSNNAGFPANSVTLGQSQTFGAYPTDKWVKWVFKYRGDPTGTTGFLQAWMTVDGVTTQVLNVNGIQIGTAPQGYPTDYIKFGLDQFGDGGGANGRWALLRSGYLFQDNGNTESQIRALMDSGTGSVTPTPTPVPQSVSLTITNLPPLSTTLTSASIGYTVTGSTATVYCRLDSYSPIICPNPFVLGATSPLTVGTHSVDFYIDRGTGVTAVSVPDKSYSWTITAPAPSPTPTPTPTGTQITVAVTGPGTITTTPSGINCGTVCTATFPAGTALSFIATPSAGYTFKNWSGKCYGITNCTAVSGATVLTANFTALTSTTPTYVTFYVGTTGQGTVTSNPTGINCGTTCAHVFLRGTPINIIATPSSGYTFKNWSGRCYGIPGCTSVTGAMVLIANFAAVAVTPTPTPAPTPTPTPAPASTKFTMGQHVTPVGTNNVRETPGGTLLGTQTTGMTGTIAGGPSLGVLSGVTYTWWNVNFASGVDGWVGEDGLTAYTAPAPTPTPLPMPTPSTTSCSGGITPLAQLPDTEAGTAIDGGSPTYDGVTPITWNGNVMLGPAQDPNGSGRTVDIHRIMEAAPYAWGTTHRSEILWIGKSNYSLPPSVDTWQAFAVMRKVGENLPPSTGDDSLLVYQAHTPASGDTGPPYALVMNRQSGIITWDISYNANPSTTWNYVGGPNPDRYDVRPNVHTEPLMPEGVWYRYIVHYRAGYDLSQNPIMEVWRAKPGASFEKLFTYTGLNAYNAPDDEYPRIGVYKWDQNWNGQSSLAFYETPLYYGRGANLYDQAAAALCGL